jgi:FkbM family methyltransferase
MLIPFSKCVEILREYNFKVNGILHIGAHQCEELKDYNENGVNENDIVWIEANPKLVEFNKQNGINNIYCLAVDNEEGEASFNVTNNGQSSSLLNFGTHKESYPWCIVNEVIKVNKQKLTTFSYNNPNVNFTTKNFWNLDIQGSELNALKSAGDLINNVDAIYSEVNTEYVYENCGLLEDMDKFLLEKGFKRTHISMTNQGWGDALWVRIKILTV